MAMEILQKDIEQFKSSVEMMSNGVETMMKRQAIITELISEVKQQFVRLNMDQEEKSVSLENRLDALEQYSRMNDVIILGLKVELQSFLQLVKHRPSSESSPEDEMPNDYVKLQSFLPPVKCPASESSPEHGMTTEEQVR